MNRTVDAVMLGVMVELAVLLGVVEELSVLLLVAVYVAVDDCVCIATVVAIIKPFVSVGSIGETHPCLCNGVGACARR